MERLGQLIEDAITKKEWKPIRLSKNGHCILHLFFTDDLLLFCRASEVRAECLRKTFDLFCHFVGHRVNKKKTQIYFFSNVNEAVAQRICGNLSFTRVSNLGIYLGIPLFLGRVGVSTFQFLIDKVRNKLSSWDMRKLSLAGRLILVKSVLMAIPNYFVATVKILNTVCNEIECLAHMFL